MSEIDPNHIAKEHNCLAYRVSHKMMQEIIYHLEAGDVRDRANLAHDLKKLLKDAPMYQGRDAG